MAATMSMNRTLNPNAQEDLRAPRQHRHCCQRRARQWHWQRRCRLVAATTQQAAAAAVHHVASMQQAATGRVYRATCPLVGWEPFEAALGDLYPPQLALHHFVVVETPAVTVSPSPSSSSSSISSRRSGISSSSSSSSGSGAASAVVAYDFLPADPTSPLIISQLLGGGSVPGVIRVRHLRSVPRLRCQLQGATRLSDPHAAAAAFQQTWDCRLRLLHNDCTHYADRLIQYLLHGTLP